MRTTIGSVVGISVGLFIASLLVLSSARADEDEIETETEEAVEEVSQSLLVDFPHIKVKSTGKATMAEAERIKKLIRDLAKLENPDYGLSSTLTGDAFAPIDGSGRFSAGLITNHDLKRDESFKRIVEFGPKALPFLLASLSDDTATKLKVEHGGGFGAMWFDDEIYGNSVNKHEAKVLAGLDRTEELAVAPHVDQYSVCIGDVCFVAIGQITNRSYSAVRYQPTACIVINSPVNDKKLAATVRAIWGDEPDRQELLNSLLIDFHTRGGYSDEMQSGAALRMAYYFPDETSDLIAKRLKDDDIGADFVKAVSCSPRQEICASLVELVRATPDPEILLAALPGVGKEHDKLVFDKIKEQLDKLPDDNPGPFCKAYYLLIEVGKRFPDRAEDVFQNYLKPQTVSRRRTVIHALRETSWQLSVSLLAPLLVDKRDDGWSYAVNPEENEPRLPIRVCDEAAETIALTVKGLKFEMKGSHEHLDVQITALKQQIEKGEAK